MDDIIDNITIITIDVTSFRIKYPHLTNDDMDNLVAYSVTQHYIDLLYGKQYVNMHRDNVTLLAEVLSQLADDLDDVLTPIYRIIDREIETCQTLLGKDVSERYPQDFILRPNLIFPDELGIKYNNYQIYILFDVFALSNCDKCVMSVGLKLPHEGIDYE